MIGDLTVIPLLFILVTSMSLLLNLHWRWTILAFAIQYIGVFWLVSQNWPLGLATVKLVAGWMAGAILASTQVNNESELSLGFMGLSGRIFRVIAGLFVLIIAFSIVGQISTWIPGDPNTLLSGVVLMMMGLLQLGMTTVPFRSMLGLLSAFSGFELIYATVVTSVLVTGLLAVITLGLALAGSYFMSLEKEQEAA
mgnify:CR=1 FL=1